MEDDGNTLSPEMRAMKWEWTPELLELRQRGWDTEFHNHPDLGPNLNDNFKYKYSPSLPLPAYNDKRAMMRFCGLNDKRIDALLEEYDRKHGEDPQPSFEIQTHGDGRTYTDFPVLRRLMGLFTRRDDGDLFDYEENYEGYIKKGVQQGLRPEFAIWCGLHEDDPREKEKQSWAFKPNWYKHSPMYYVDEVFTDEYCHLSRLWSEKLIADGKVKETEHGDVLIEDQDEGGRSDRVPEPDGAQQ